MKLEEILDVAELRRLIGGNYITARDHPSLPLQILNYTPKTQFARHWTNETELSRGLVFDTRDNTIVARAFRKFFNLGERPDAVMPDEPFVAYEKLDGCLGISYVDADGGRRSPRAARSRPSRRSGRPRSSAPPTPTPSIRCWRSARSPSASRSS